MCESASETLHHAFWECVSAKSFWFRIHRLLGRKYRSAIYMWGALGNVRSTNGLLSLSSFFFDFTCEKFSGICYFKFLAWSQVFLMELCLADCLLFGFMGSLKS